MLLRYFCALSILFCLFCSYLVPLIQSGKQAAQTDVHGTQIGDLVDLELGVEPVSYTHLPYSTGTTLRVREFRGKSASPTLWTTIAAMEA